MLDKVDIVDVISDYVDLRRVGNVWKGRCPIHDSEGSNVLAVWGDTQTYKCFSCDSGGTVIDFLIDMENTTAMGAIEKLANKVGIQLESDEEYKDMNRIINVNEKYIGKSIEGLPSIIDYLRIDRGFTDETISKWELGYYDGITIPMRDQHGRLAGFAKRQFNKDPKYLHPKCNALYERSTFLYGLDKIKRTKSNSIYLVEGYMDAISGYQLELPTVAYCGNELLKSQISMLIKYVRPKTTLVIAPDNDLEGIKKIRMVRDNLAQYAAQFQARVLIYPDGCKDMNDFLLTGKGVEELRTEHIDEFVLKYLLKIYIDEAEQYDVVYDFLQTVKNKMLLSDLCEYLAVVWKKSYEEVREWVNAPKTNAEQAQELSDYDECFRDLLQSMDGGEFYTGYQQIDRCVRRVKKKQVLTIGAYSSSGKTDVACELALNFVAQGLRTIFFSLEMPKGHLLLRLMSKVLGKRTDVIEQLIRNNDPLILSVREKINKYLLIVDTDNLSMQDIEDRIALTNRLQLMGGNVDSIIVDYFTYIKGCDDFEGASKNARAMKAIAKRNDIIFVMLSQLNRGGSTFVEPEIQHLRMTGDLESSSDIILLLWRPDLNPSLTLEELQAVQNITMFKVAKSRDGIFGPIRCRYYWNPNTGRLEESAEK